MVIKGFNNAVEPNLCLPTKPGLAKAQLGAASGKPDDRARTFAKAICWRCRFCQGVLQRFHISHGQNSTSMADWDTVLFESLQLL